MRKYLFKALFGSAIVIMTLAGCGGGGSTTTSGIGAPASSDPITGATFTAQLAWSAPTLNEDASALTDLAGYKVYYGTSAGIYTNSVDVGAVTSYQVTDLDNTVQYHFAISAYDSSGNESAPSEEIVL